MQCNIKYNARFIFNFLAGKSAVFLHSLHYWHSQHLLPLCLSLSLISLRDSHDEVGGGKGGEKFQSLCSTLPDR